MSKPYKLIETGDDKTELYDVIADPAETVNLQAQQPAVVQELHAALQNYARQAEAATITAGEIATQDDPQLRQRLRALGYLD